jgi:hypothetical protein
VPENEQKQQRVPLEKNAGCFCSDEENRLILSVSKSDFEKIKEKISQNWTKRRNFGIVRVTIMQSEAKLSPVEQLTGTILLRLEPD